MSYLVENPEDRFSRDRAQIRIARFSASESAWWSPYWERSVHLALHTRSVLCHYLMFKKEISSSSELLSINHGLEVSCKVDYITNAKRE